MTHHRPFLQDTAEIDATIGKHIRRIRRAVNMSQHELAERIGVTFQAVQKYETAANRVCAARLFKISRILGVPLDSFFGDLP